MLDYFTKNNIPCCVNVQSNIGEEGRIPLGPWGGSGGGYWAYKLDVAPIMQITLGYGLVIDSILIESKSRDGNVIGCSDRFGGPGGEYNATVSPLTLFNLFIDRSGQRCIWISSMHVGPTHVERFWTHLCPDLPFSFVSIAIFLKTFLLFIVETNT